MHWQCIGSAFPVLSQCLGSALAVQTSALSLGPLSLSLGPLPVSLWGVVLSLVVTELYKNHVFYDKNTKSDSDSPRDPWDHQVGEQTVRHDTTGN